jgi:hypothetical protein
VRTRGFAIEAHRQSLAVAGSRNGRDDQQFIDEIAELKVM